MCIIKQSIIDKELKDIEIKRKKSIKKFFWLLWDLSSFRLIYSRIRPEKTEPNKRAPSIFMLWFLGIYFAAFSIASSRYENRKDVLETRLTVISTQLALEKSKKGAFRRLVNIQIQTIPRRPKIDDFISTFRSFLINDVDSDILTQSQEIIIAEKERLDILDLRRVNLVKKEIDYSSIDIIKLLKYYEFELNSNIKIPDLIKKLG